MRMLIRTTTMIIAATRITFIRTLCIPITMDGTEDGMKIGCFGRSKPIFMNVGNCMCSIGANPACSRGRPAGFAFVRKLPGLHIGCRHRRTARIRWNILHIFN